METQKGKGESKEQEGRWHLASSDKKNTKKGTRRGKGRAHIQNASAAVTQQCLERVASLPAAKECVSYKDFLQPLNALSRNGVSL